MEIAIRSSIWKRSFDASSSSCGSYEAFSSISFYRRNERSVVLVREKILSTGEYIETMHSVEIRE